MAKTARDYLRSPQGIALLMILGVLFLVGLILILGRPAKERGTVTPDQIRIQKGDKIVTVNRNGLIEYKTPDGVFYQTWDSSQVTNFFALMEARAREYLANPNPAACASGYTVTLYVDGKEVTVCFAPDDEVMGEIFQEFPDVGGNGDLGDLFADYFGDGGVSPGGTATPTPTPAEIAASEGEDVPGGGSGSLPVYTCELNQEDVTERTVISNILCAPEKPSPTPTLAP